MNNRPIALIYVRVSTGRQATTGHSLESQPKILTAAAQKDGYTVKIIRETASGRKAARPQLSSALQMLAEGKAHALYALDIDRLARSTMHLLELANLSKNQGWRLVVVSADVDTSTPAGEMFFTLAAAFAQYESRMISERVLRQHAARRNRGEIWGVNSGPVTELPKNVVDEIFRLNDEGYGASRIARMLEEKCVSTARGGRWAAGTIQGILKSPRASVWRSKQKSSTEVLLQTE